MTGERTAKKTDGGRAYVNYITDICPHPYAEGEVVGELYKIETAPEEGKYRTPLIEMDIVNDDLALAREEASNAMEAMEALPKAERGRATDRLADRLGRLIMLRNDIRGESEKLGYFTAPDGKYKIGDRLSDEQVRGLALYGSRPEPLPEILRAD
jgi:hypothetical protein